MTEEKDALEGWRDEKFINPIIEAAEKGELVIFIGAGLSRVCGLPSWDSLADWLLSECVNLDGFSYADKDMISKSITDPREKISIAYNLMEQSGKKELFFSNMKEALKTNEIIEAKAEPLRKNLWKMSDLILTTNADELLDVGRDQKYILYGEKKIKDFRSLTSKRVIHIHGSLRDCSSLVFRTSDYLRAYANDDSSTRWVLQSIFQDEKYTVLIIGYGLREMQLLDFLVNSKRDDRKKIFYLNGYYTTQKRIFELEKDYYKEYAVSLIPYCMDEKAYDSIINVIEELAGIFDKTSGKTANFINSLIKALHDGENQEGLSKIKNELHELDDRQKRFLTEEISSCKESAKWIVGIYNDKQLKDVFFGKNLDLSITLIGDNLRRADDKLRPIINELMLKAIKESTNGEFKDSQLNHHIFRIGFSDPTLFSSEQFKEFIKNVTKSNDSITWIPYSTFNKILERCPSNDVAIFYLQSAMEQAGDNLSREEYFFDRYEKFYTGPKLAGDTFRLLVKKISQEKESGRSFINGTYEANLEESSSLPLGVNYIKRWIALSAKNLSDEEAGKEFSRLIKSDSEEEIKLAIFIANAKFNLLGQMIIDKLRDLKNRDYYSEIYSLIKSHTSEIAKNDDLIDKTYSYVLEIDYAKDSGAYFSEKCKYYLANLFESFNIPTFEKIASISSSRMADIKNEIPDIDIFAPGPLEVSNHIWLGRSMSYKTKEFKNEIQSVKNLEDFFGICETNAENIFHIKQALLEEETFKKLNTSIRLLDKMDKNPDVFVKTLDRDITIQLLRSTVVFKALLPEKICELLLKYAKEADMEDNSGDLIDLLFETLCYKGRIDITEETASAVFSFASTSKPKHKGYVVRDHIAGDYRYKKYSLMIYAYSINKELRNPLFGYIDLENDHCRAAVASSLYFLWNLEKEWCKTNLAVILKVNDSENIFLDIPFFQSISARWLNNNDFLSYLDERKLLRQYLESNLTERVGTNVIAGTMIAYLDGRAPKSLLEKVSASKLSPHALLWLLIEPDLKINGKGLDEIVAAVLQETDVTGKVDSLIGIDLLKYGKQVSDVDNLVNLYTKIVSHDSIDPLYAGLLKEAITQDERLEKYSFSLISVFVEHMRVNPFTFVEEDLVELVNSAKITANERKSLINKLGQKEPGYFKAFKKQSADDKFNDENIAVKDAVEDRRFHD